MGRNRSVKVDYGEPGIELTFIKLSGESDGDAGDQYTGLDRFGQVVDMRWLESGTSTKDIKCLGFRHLRKLHR